MLELLKPIYTNVWYVLLIALFFGGSIFVHELGHFLAARRRGLKVDRFSIGFGPKIVSWTRNGVEYRLSWIPLGGYVALPQLADMRGIEGEPTEDTAQLPPISYTDKMIVSVMGAVFNLLFAFLLACILWAIKQPIRADQTTTTIGYVSATVPIEQANGIFRDERSPAALAGLQVGDRVVSIDGNVLRDWEDLHYAVLTGTRRDRDGRRLAQFVIERDGRTLELDVYPRLSGEDERRTVGIDGAYDVLVDRVPEESLAHELGLQPRDVIVSLDGTPIRNAQTYLEVLERTAHRATTLVVQRGEQQLEFTVPPRPGVLIAGVQPGSPAAALGLQTGDYITGVDGEPLQGMDALITKLQNEPTATFPITVRRGAETLSFTVPPRPLDNGRLGVSLQSFALGERITIKSQLVRLNPVRQFQRIVTTTFSTLGTLIDPRSDIGLSDMNGPIGIISVYYDAVRAEFRFVLWLTLVVNINLAIFNLLPIPVLDGGHMLFATISKLRGRALSPHFLMTTQSVFMVLLLTLVVYVSFFDVRRQWRGIFGDDRPARTQPAPAAPAEPETPAPPAADPAEPATSPAN